MGMEQRAEQVAVEAVDNRVETPKPVSLVARDKIQAVELPEEVHMVYTAVAAAVTKARTAGLAKAEPGEGAPQMAASARTPTSITALVRERRADT